MLAETHLQTPTLFSNKKEMADFYFLYSIIYLFYIHFREKKDLICLYVARIKKVVTPPPRKINGHVLTEGISQILTIFLSKAKRFILFLYMTQTMHITSILGIIIVLRYAYAPQYEENGAMC